MSCPRPACRARALPEGATATLRTRAPKLLLNTHGESAVEPGSEGLADESLRSSSDTAIPGEKRPDPALGGRSRSSSDAGDRSGSHGSHLVLRAGVLGRMPKQLDRPVCRPLGMTAIRPTARQPGVRRPPTGRSPPANRPPTGRSPHRLCPLPLLHSRSRRAPIV